MEKATLQQLRFIASLIEHKKEDYEWLKEVWESTPKNNEKYPNTKADYRNQILAERLQELSPKQANYIIKAWQGDIYFHPMTARNILTACLK